MAVIRGVFPRDAAVPVSEATAARVAAAEQIRETLTDFEHTHEMLGPMSYYEIDRPNDLMPPDDEVANKWGGPESFKIFDEMGRNVLPYRAFHDMRIDVVTGLQWTILPGQKGNKESETAAEEMRSHWENIDEKMIAMKSAGRFIERGFAALECVWGESTRGKSKGQITIEQLIDRPESWFGFTWKNRPVFKSMQRDKRIPEYIAELKVMFGRYGSLNKPYGRGIGQDDYPYVWTIDAVQKGHYEAVEKWGFLPIVVTYPDNRSTWPKTRVARLEAEMKRQWKNVLVVPGEVDSVKTTLLAEGSMSAASVVGQSRMEIINANVAALAMHIQGSQYSAGNQSEGSYARDQVADAARLYKAPGDAACFEAMLNRGFVRPLMLANRPAMDETLWPRFAIDASFAEDLRLLLEIMREGVKMGAAIDTVTFSERFKIPLAQLPLQPGQTLLQAPAVSSPFGAPDPNAEEDPAATVEGAASSFSESGSLVVVKMRDGSSAHFRPSQAVYTENRGPVRANMLESGDRPVLPVSMSRAS